MIDLLQISWRMR